MLYIGGPVWGSKAWLGNFFPPRTPARDFLRLYSQRLLAIEGNTVFYALPSEELIARWRQETPSTFRFCPKVSRSISHAPRIDHTREETHLFTERMRGLEDRLGPMFLQLPPSFAPSHLERLQAFLDFWPANLRLAVEVRHPAFYTDQQAASLNALLEQYQIGRVIMDTRPLRTGETQDQALLATRERKPNLPLQIARTTNFAFLRYIGHPEMAINEPFLDEWAQQLGQWLKQGTTLYVFCHCSEERYAPDLCAALYRRVQALVPLPPLPWQPDKQLVKPMTLFDDLLAD
ncbi:MAG TPA: DUF72 domain-containing protein [Ktedonobacterales bacterium]|nr:DUF72 domain-containing protein [Ktedonobacterales bacterium]